MQIARENIENLFVNMVLGKKTFKRHKFKKTHFHVSLLGNGLPIWNYPSDNPDLLNLSYLNQIWSVIYLFFEKKIILWNLKFKIFYHTFLFINTKNGKTYLKVCHNCLQYEKVFKILYFHILNIVKFGKIYLWTIATWITSQICKNKKALYESSY
jgi:hypothetical protein